MLKLRSCEAIKVLRPMRDESESPGSRPEEKQRIKLQLIYDPRLALSVTIGLDDIQDLQDPLAIRENTQLLLEQKHVIRQITDLLINIEALRGTHYFHLTMTLELKPVSDLYRKLFEITIIPDHANFIYDQERMRLKLIVTNILDRDIITTGYWIRTVYRPSVLEMLQSHLCK